MREPFPLQWPEGWTRTKSFVRKHSRFNGSYALARDAVKYELGRIRGANIVVTSNIRLNSRGVPDGRTDGKIEDPGVAVWWMEKGGIERVMACDRWRTPGENLRGIAKSLEALRGVERWGASQIVERAFAGFAALPAAGETIVKPDWWEVLDIDPKLFEIGPENLLAIAHQRYKKLAPLAHPDRGGDVDKMAALTEAYELAQAYCKNESEEQ